MLTPPTTARRLRPHRHPTASRQQSGVVLIVALIMLVVIALTSAAVMRNSLDADMTSQNTRRQTQAMQAAQTALNYCEGLARSGTADTYVKPAVATLSEEFWNKASQWSAPATPVTATAPEVSNYGQVNVPKDILVSSVATDPPRFAPQCMAQYRAVGADQVVVVTAKGFSSDYQESSGRTQNGSVVWLQSVLRLASSTD